MEDNSLGKNNCLKMSMVLTVPLFALLLFLFLFSCRERAPQVPANKLPDDSYSKELMELNREFAELEDAEINHYIDSLHLDMKQTSTGLRYRIVKEGDGDFPQKNDKVTFDYTIRLLDNTVCAQENGLKTIELGKGAIENGIEEAILLLKVCGKGEFIIPSHLAFGVAGYKNCVPAWTPIFCEINLIEKNRVPKMNKY